MSKDNQFMPAYAQLLPDNQYIFVRTNTDQTVQHISPSITSMSGKTVDTFTNQPVELMFIPPHRSKMRVLLGECDKEPDAPHLKQLQLSVAQDSPRWVEVTAIKQSDGIYELMLRDLSQEKDTEKALNERLLQLTILHQVESELAERLNITYVLTMALDAVIRLAEADYGYICQLVNDEVTNLHFIGDYDKDAVRSSIEQGLGINGRVIRNLKAEMIMDVTQDDEYIVLQPGTCAKMAIPLVSQNTLIGLVSIETSHPERYDEERFEFIKLITRRVAVALDNARLYRETADQLRIVQGLYAQVKELEALKTDMIRIASHDLRTPLTIIVNYVKLIEMQLDDAATEKVMEYLRTVQDAANRMTRMTNDILSVERIEASAKNPVMIAVDLYKIVKEGFTVMQPNAQLKNQDYIFDVEEGVYMVKGDPIQLTEAINNLISNAIKYTPDEGTVRVSLNKRGSMADFSVVDNGHGIPEAQQERLFQPFYRVRTPEVYHIEGTGLGLHLVKNIIERHSGEMKFSSVHNEGSMFGFTLPISG